MDFLTEVKLAIYRTFADTTHAPTVSDFAQQLGASTDDVQEAFHELHKKRLIVPEPDDPTRIRMAPPFSSIPTSFRVSVGITLRVSGIRSGFRLRSTPTAWCARATDKRASR